MITESCGPFTPGRAQPPTPLNFDEPPSLAVGDFGWWHHGFRGWQQTRDWAMRLFNDQPRLDGVSASAREQP
jgi:hypothetical protein